MRQRASVRVRGIYSTALTILLREQGFRIVDASPIIQARLGLSHLDGPEDVAVFDRRNRQGVVLEGRHGPTLDVVQCLQKALPHALFASARRTRERDASDTAGAKLRYRSEFPAPTKARLDRVRAREVPTLPGHHALKTIDAAAVDDAEARLGADPQQAADLSQALRERLVYRHFHPEAEVRVCHVKAGQRRVELRGRVRQFTPGTLLLSRSFRGGGTYDGLRLPIENGDWGTLLAHEGEWVTVRRYFRQAGTLLGEIYNIGTPVEFYPRHLHYVDLELDVVRLPDGTCRLEDEAVLADQLATGRLPPALGAAAIRIAAELLQQLAKEV